MTEKQIIQKVLSLKTNQERVEFLKDLCFQKILELTDDSELVEKLKSKQINIKFVSPEEIKELRAGKPNATETEGFYNYPSKTMFVSNISDEHSIHSFIHEFMHALSHFLGDEKFPEKRGIKLADQSEDGAMSKKEKVTTDYNEGLTDKIAELIFGRKSNHYSSSKHRLAFLQSMCGLDDKNMIKCYFQETPWVTDKIKQNFNPQTPNSFEDEFLKDFLVGDIIEIMEEIEKKYLPHCSKEIKDATEKLFEQKKNDYGVDDFGLN